MNIQRIKGVLLAITVSMGFILVLMPQVAFSEVQIHVGFGGNTQCTFLDKNGDPTITVISPDKIKVVVNGNSKKWAAMCKDDILTTNADDGPRIVFEGSDCTVSTASGFSTNRPYKQVINQKGMSLTCD